MRRKRASAIWPLCLMISCCGVGQSAAQRGKPTPPLPPPRPSFLPSPTLSEPPLTPVTREQIAPALPEPDVEPEATRAQMRACSLEWRHMKASGAAVGLVWREFFKSCSKDK